MTESPLRMRRVLVVEDEYLLAEDLGRALSDAGAKVVGPAGSVERALALLAAEHRLDAAVLDINLRGEPAYAIADDLAARGVPFVFNTGFDVASLPERFAGVRRCEKPISVSAIVEVIVSFVEGQAAPPEPLGSSAPARDALPATVKRKGRERL